MIKILLRFRFSFRFFCFFRKFIILNIKQKKKRAQQMKDEAKKIIQRKGRNDLQKKWKILQNWEGADIRKWCNRPRNNLFIQYYIYLHNIHILFLALSSSFSRFFAVLLLLINIIILLLCRYFFPFALCFAILSIWNYCY